MNHLQPTEARSESPTKGSFKPRIVLFQCRFNHYSNADLQQIETLDTGSVKCIQVPCAGRISPLFILNAVQDGADGIAVSGCRPGVCHYQQGNLGARRQLAAFRDLLTYVGMAAGRFHFVWLDPADRGRLAGEMKALIAAVEALGPARRLVARPYAMPAMGANDHLQKRLPSAAIG